MTCFDTNPGNELNRIAAQKINEKLRILRNYSNSAIEKRWIWELLQNAHDKSLIDFPDSQVSIEIQLTQDSLSFKHNYGYFSNPNIRGLIRQSSNRGDEDETDSEKIRRKKIGRFGTGFLTTHLLSEQLIVEGFFKKDNDNFKPIKFSIDRTGNNVNQHCDNIQKSFEEAAKCLEKEDNSTYDYKQLNTKFLYSLDEKGRRIARKGIDDLKASLPYTLISIERLESVKIKETLSKSLITETEYRKVNCSELDNKIKLFQIRRINNSKASVDLYFICNSESSTSVVIPCHRKEKQIEIQKISENVPKLFIGFPLLGTEEFGFPSVINDPSFEPEETRDGVFLGQDSQEANSNKLILKKAIELFFDILKVAIEKNWKNLHWLAYTPLPVDKPWLDLSWYEANVRNVLRNTILKSKIVQTNNQRKIELERSVFPIGKSVSIREHLWKFANSLGIDNLPAKEDIENWAKIIDSSWDNKLHYDIQRLTADVAIYFTVSQLSEAIKKNEDETLALLNEIINLIYREENSLLNDYKIIPTQSGKLKLFKELYKDNNISEVLKNVVEIFDSQFRDILMSSKIRFEKMDKVWTIQNTANHINEYLKKDNPVVTKRTIVLNLFSCLPSDTQSPLFKIRKTYFHLAKYFDITTPNESTISNWVDDIWSVADGLFFRYICLDLQTEANIRSYQQKLASERQVEPDQLCLSKLLEKLNNFFNLLVECKFSELLNQYSALPNQEGKFCQKKALYQDSNIDENLKGILERLGDSCRAKLLDTGIKLDLEGKEKTSQDIAYEIIERTNQIFRKEIDGSQRSQRDKDTFAKLLVWFHNSPETAKEIFQDFYEKRYRLRSDEDIIADIQFREKLRQNSNGYTEEEIFKLINNTPKDLLEELSETYINNKDNQEDLINVSPEKLLITYAISTNEELKSAIERHPELFKHISDNDLEKLAHVQKIIDRAIAKVKEWLSHREEYDCKNWHGENTVISGVKKAGHPIKLVIRPSDEKKVIIYYPNEFNALEISDTELWVDNGIDPPENLTLGKIMKNTGINQIPLFRV